MKMRKFIFVRHGKPLEELEKTLPKSELVRAEAVGTRLYELSNQDIDQVVYSPLPRAIQTAFGVVMGHGCTPELLPAIPAFGNERLFAEMSAKEGFRERGAVEGYFAVLNALHGTFKFEKWVTGFVEVFDELFDSVPDKTTTLVVVHSPVIECLLYGLFRRQGRDLPDEFLKMGELDAVSFGASCEGNEPIRVGKNIEKILAPAIEPKA